MRGHEGDMREARGARDATSVAWGRSDGTASE